MGISIEPELRTELKNNQRTIFITEADELLAAWQFQRKSSPKRSKNTSMVPAQWRYSIPPSEKSPLMPCHVSCQGKTSMIKPIEYGPSYSTRACHQTYEKTVKITPPDLDALDAVSFAKRNVAPYISPILDTVTLGLVAKDLGLTGKAIPKVINGRQYIAFVETTGARVVFPGTLYAVRDRKLINMAIGSLGIKNMAVKGGILTICITVPLTILECFLKDPHSLADFAGNLASDLIKIGVPTLMGYIFGMTVGTATTFVLLPIAVAISVSLFTGILMNALDDRYQLTAKLITALEKLDQQYGVRREQIAGVQYEIERKLILRMSGMDIGKLRP